MPALPRTCLRASSRRGSRVEVPVFEWLGCAPNAARCRSISQTFFGRTGPVSLEPSFAPRAGSAGRAPPCELPPCLLAHDSTPM
ncbi:hypothetical protein HETIRDRAFT_437586 [Heterobasidion irregulare TC 32-1]|uniref:Uncharacterized protein n=1 Tax=Heterobasidion irregulare (strain TC 32-1) TaxID=747525 RepID=W4KMB6_HETIT|nr:uncharacterized protein HETIRDRAFT_437586 [Heterobasidion irregulare TC 32-1]ETW86834.1 hypothetical protein HETIRDRAFT_437586 [Heterobasidion irregulare TC 32-1]